MTKEKPLKIRQCGSPVLRLIARQLTGNEIQSQTIQALMTRMENLLVTRKLGVGLAAPQVGESIAFALIKIQKTPLRPEAEDFRLAMFNPVITNTYGRKIQLWEGCISCGSGHAGLFAKVPRYKKIELEYYDETAQKHTQVFEGLPAHVIQHEVDHLSGVLFLDKVKDTKSYMSYSEYRKMKRRTK